ncbi:type-2 ice-structuring protein-like isoform X2 [Cheilinus undulatus]|uniref:type-2 ice-structuring protein-like isoform X2 n=1 Tax=Cheilinus undulatus TaxID=241271 RepID=UPI001BD5D6FD|nr:type-2 ice-structuring protein-like isoform X2 [Cheilinus undulatus]
MSVMKILAVTLLLCAMVVLTEAEPGPKPEPENEIAPAFPKETHLFKRCKACPSGWTLWSHRCYLYVSSPLTWAQAERNCQAKGGNLVSVHSNGENHLVQWLIVTYTHKYGQTWLGGSDAQQEGIWLWSDGSVFNYRYHGGFDNAHHRQHCLQTNWGVHKYWDDIECWTMLPSVCARKP